MMIIVKRKKRCNLISVLYLYRRNLNPRCPSPHDWHTLLAVVALIGNGKVVEPVKWIIPTWSWTHTPKHSTRAVRFNGNDGNPDWDGQVSPFHSPPAPWAAIKIVDESPTCWLVPLRLVKRKRQKKDRAKQNSKETKHDTIGTTARRDDMFVLADDRKQRNDFAMWSVLGGKASCKEGRPVACVC